MKKHGQPTDFFPRARIATSLPTGHTALGRAIADAQLVLRRAGGRGFRKGGAFA